MERSGHFEFGVGRRPMNLGDLERTSGILHAWEQGQEVRGWARAWDAVYRYLARLLDRDAAVRRAAIVVRFETLCADPTGTIDKLMGHCALPDVGRVIDRFAPVVRFPDYYQHSFSQEELAAIREETAQTAALWGY
jgi:hypothetical protein